MNANLKQEFLKMVRTLSYEKKTIILASGRESDFYIDMKNTLLHPKGVKLASELIAEGLAHFDGELQGIGGVTMGADPITTTVSLKTLDW